MEVEGYYHNAMDTETRANQTDTLERCCRYSKPMLGLLFFIGSHQGRFTIFPGIFQGDSDVVICTIGYLMDLLIKANFKPKVPTTILYFIISCFARTFTKNYYVWTKSNTQIIQVMTSN